MNSECCSESKEADFPARQAEDEQKIVVAARGGERRNKYEVFHYCDVNDEEWSLVGSEYDFYRAMNKYYGEEFELD